MQVVPIEVGKKYNRLTVVRCFKGRDKNGRSLRLVECDCDCGNKGFVARANAILSGNTKSCGCLHKESSKKNVVKASVKNRTHGETKTRLYRIWKGMKCRCLDKKHHEYKNYGGRGIGFCSEWNDYATFSKWAHESGYVDNLTLDRRDNNQGYCPENCVWANWKEQANNKRNNRMLEFDGKKMTMTQWCELMGIRKNVVFDRIKRGWSVKDALTKKIDISKRNHVPRPIVHIERLTDWRLVLTEARKTMGLSDAEKEPTSIWKRKILLSRHSPIRSLVFRISIENLKYWISVHFCRHSLGITHFVQSQRDDRNEDRAESRDDLPQSALVKHDMILNAESIINISKKRLCSKASIPTRKVWESVKQEMYRIGETELADCMMPECGWTAYTLCPEMKPCGRCPSLYNALEKNFTNFSPQI